MNTQSVGLLHPIITVMLMDVLLDAWSVSHVFVQNSLYYAARLLLRLSETLCSEAPDTALSSCALKSYNLRLGLGRLDHRGDSFEVRFLRHRSILLTVSLHTHSSL